MNAYTHDLLERLRAGARERRARAPSADPALALNTADRVVKTVGSWRFVLIQSGVLAAWILFNAVSSARVDPYPFILLNLLLSFQAAYTAPIILMSQSRQTELDRARAAEDFEINRKAELEIETLHQKIDLMREQEIAALTAAVSRLTALLEAKQA